MKKLTFMLIGLLTVLSAWAGPVSREQARSQASDFLASRGIVMTTNDVAYRAPRKAAKKTDQVYYYVFNVGGDKGFVVMSGDDRTEPVLGYCDEGSFDEATAPPHMLSFLQGLADEIQYLDDNNVEGSKLNAQRVRRYSKPVQKMIKPLVSTRWNQGDPYNRMCPEYYNKDGSRGEHAVTGCVATAMAQVIGYWRYPDVTRGNVASHTNTYDTPDGKKTVTLPTIRRGAAIDWEHMRDTYSSANTDEEKDAVAWLMLLCGQSLKMGYGASSGASTGYAPEPLRYVFGFDNSVYAASRGNYTLDEWNSLVYGELQKGRPVMYAGHSTGGGHAFVIDGYDGEGLYHVNWGWGGSSDGYFRITILNPGDNSGIGASSSSDGYSMSQCAIINAIPAQSGSERYMKNMTIDNITLTTDDEGYPAINSRYINWTGAAGTFTTGIGFLTDDGSFSIIGDTNRDQYGANILRYRQYSIKGLSPGHYKVAPVSKNGNAGDWAPAFNMSMQWFDVTVGDDLKPVVTWVKAEDGLQLENINYTGNYKAGSKQTFDATFSCSVAEYFGTIYCFASPTEEKGERTCCSALSVRKDGQETVTFYFDTKAEDVGTWHIWLATNSNGSNVIGETTVELTKNGVNGLRPQKLAIVSNVISNKTGNSIYGGVIAGTLNLKNNGTEDFDGIVRITSWRDMFDEAPGYYRGNGDVNLHFTIPAGGTQAQTYFFNNKEVGRAYGLSFYNTWAGENIQGLGGVGNMVEGVVNYLANGRITGSAPAAVLTLPSNVACVDLRHQSTVKTIRPGKNTSTIFLLNEDTEVAGIDGMNIVRGDHADEITYTDGDAFLLPININVDRISYVRTFTAPSYGRDQWSTLVLPFAPASITCEGEELLWKADDEQKNLFIKDFTSLDDDDTPQFTFVNSLLPYNPYVIAAAPALVGKEVVFSAEDLRIDANIDVVPRLASDAYDFIGTWTSGRLNNIYVINDDGSAFEPVERNGIVGNMRAYFVSKRPAESQLAKIIISDEELLAISRPSADRPTAVLYDLQGRRLDGTPAKGLYISAGRKVIVK